jgi:hypothetical protein
MSRATEWSGTDLQSKGRGSVGLALRVARLQEGCVPSSGPDRQDEDPPGQFLDVLEAFSTEHLRLSSRQNWLEGTRSNGTEQAHLPHRGPMGSAVDAMEWIDSELAGFAASLARLEVAGHRERRGNRLLVICPTSCPASEQAQRGSQSRKGVRHA